VTRVHRPGFTDHIYALQRKRMLPLVRHDASMCHTFYSHVCSLRPPDLYPRMSTLQHIATCCNTLHSEACSLRLSDMYFANEINIPANETNTSANETKLSANETNISANEINISANALCVMYFETHTYTSCHAVSMI